MSDIFHKSHSYVFFSLTKNPYTKSMSVIYNTKIFNKNPWIFATPFSILFSATSLLANVPLHFYSFYLFLNNIFPPYSNIILRNNYAPQCALTLKQPPTAFFSVMFQQKLENSVLQAHINVSAVNFLSLTQQPNTRCTLYSEQMAEQNCENLAHRVMAMASSSSSSSSNIQQIIMVHNMMHQHHDEDDDSDDDDELVCNHKKVNELEVIVYLFS